MLPRAFARLDCFAAVALALVAGAVVVPSMARARGIARGGTDQAQLGLLMQGFHSFAASHNGSYPLPSRLDLGNTTVAAPAGLHIQKDNTGNIFSYMIYHGYTTPEMMVSPVETASFVWVDSGYQYQFPQRAVQPANAVWDPGFAGTPIDVGSPRRITGIGNQSYAHALPFGRRLQTAWTTWGATLQPIIANRGPTYQGTTYPASGQWALTNGPTGTLSNTLLFYGEPNRWEGYVAFNDGGVQGGVRYSEEPTPTNVRYRRNTTPLPTSTPDNMFVNETDEVNGDTGAGIIRGANSFLRPIAGVSGTPMSVTVTYWLD